MKILVTGGAGFIGSHQVLALLQAGHDVHVVDDLSNSSSLSLERVAALTGIEVPLDVVDITDRSELMASVVRATPDAVIHFAARKHVNESLHRALDYHRVNIGGLITLLEVMATAGVKQLVYSSSGSIYGDAEIHPIPESTMPNPSNPYSRTKAMGESILRDLCRTDERWSITALRYFNPAGAHESGMIGEDPTGLRTNLLPVLMDVAVGNQTDMMVNGLDYPTPDGSAVRDYVHVVDVAEAHLRALDSGPEGFRCFNIGRGVGVSVLELIAGVEQATGRSIAWRAGPRRAGDVAQLFGDTRLAAEGLGMETYRSLDTICRDAWHWQSRNPHGYRTTG